MDFYAINGEKITKIYDIYGNILLSDSSASDLVFARGKPRKSGKYLVGNDGKQLELRGFGTHALLQFQNLHTKASFQSLMNYGVNCIRLTAYIEDYYFSDSDNEIAYGYVSKPDETKAEMDKIIGYCVELGLYVLIDWHVLGNGTTGPNGTQKPANGEESLAVDYAKEFFEYFSEKYADTPNVMYELANEPYQSTNEEIVAFVEEIAPIIRKYVADPVMICNTGMSQDVAGLYTEFSNAGITDVFISAHTYGSDKSSNYEQLWKNNYPLFMTEWGAEFVSGGQDNVSDDVETIAKNLLKWHHESGVPGLIWKFTDQNQSTAILKNTGNINENKYADGFSDNDLSELGSVYLSEYKKYSTIEHIKRDVP